ncbi:MAG: fructose 1,6-bisphosphatase, partial [candidate division WOR-3 bacterium]
MKQKANKKNVLSETKKTDTPSKITISVIKADIGGYVGHSSSHPEILK